MHIQSLMQRCLAQSTLVDTSTNPRCATGFGRIVRLVLRIQPGETIREECSTWSLSLEMRKKHQLWIQENITPTNQRLPWAAHGSMGPQEARKHTFNQSLVSTQIEGPTRGENCLRLPRAPRTGLGAHISVN